MPEKQDGPQFLEKTPRGRVGDEGEAPQPKKEFTALTPPQSGPNPREDAAGKAAVIHSAQAAAARAQDRVEQGEDLPEEETGDTTPKHDDDYLDSVASRIASQFQMVDHLQNDEQKKIIEGRLEELGRTLHISQMYEQGEFRQLVPIRPGEFEVEYRSVTSEEDVKIKEMMSDEDENVSLRYLQDKYSVVSLVCAIRSINGRDLPEHFTQAKGWNQKGYEEKAKVIFRMPTQAVWSLMVNNMWFYERTQKVFKMEDLKNG